MPRPPKGGKRYTVIVYTNVCVPHLPLYVPHMPGNYLAANMAANIVDAP